MMVNVGNSVLTSFLSLLNVQLSILDLGLPSLVSQCFLHITTITTLSVLDKHTYQIIERAVLVILTLSYP